MSRFSLQKQPEESDRVRLDPTSPNKMMAMIVLLTTAAALACGAPHPNLKEITSAVKCLHKQTLDTVRHFWFESKLSHGGKMERV